MSPGYDVRAPERAVNLSLTEDLVRQARDERERRLDEVIAAWNEFDATYGSFADDHIDF